MGYRDWTTVALDAAIVARRRLPPAMLSHGRQQLRAAKDFPVLVPVRQRSIFPNAAENQFIDRGAGPETLVAWRFGMG
jgi:hypothetical protein